jgi:hypothetical protein
MAAQICRYSATAAIFFRDWERRQQLEGGQKPRIWQDRHVIYKENGYDIKNERNV